jgi:hypothetical protein
VAALSWRPCTTKLLVLIVLGEQVLLFSTPTDLYLAEKESYF